MKQKNDWEPEDVEDDPIGFSINWTLSIGIVLIILLIIGAVAFAALRPTLLHMQSQADRNSSQFVDSKVTHLQSLMSDYLTLDKEIADFGDDLKWAQSVATRRSQQLNLVKEMHHDADLIDPAFVPANIKAFLEAHPE